MMLRWRNAANSIHIGKFRLCKSAEKNCSEAGSYYSCLAYLILVALDENEEPTEVPELLPVTEAELEAWRAGARRRELRKQRKTEHF